LKQFRSPKNDRQKIVKVVRHTAGELANGIHFLTLRN
jgi:hypothetical protein